MGNKQSHSETEEHGGAGVAGVGRTARAPGGGGGGAGGTGNPDDGDDALVEVPPPMQPISSVPLSSAASGPSAEADGSNVRIILPSTFPSFHLDTVLCTSTSSFFFFFFSGC